jgi:acyl-CoA synthetase (AMP-forming)/AMP-acid ligase II
VSPSKAAGRPTLALDERVYGFRFAGRTRQRSRVPPGTAAPVISAHPRASGAATLAQLVQMRAAETPQRVAFTFVDGDAVLALSHGELERFARSFALELGEHTRPGDRALLLYPPGPAYVIAFFACALAGIIPVPLFPPPAHRTLERMRAILIDAQAAVALTDPAFAERLKSKEGELISGLRVLAIDPFGTATGDVRADAGPDEIALLQYTSGSTGTPKGVVVTHRNILANAAIVREAFSLTPDDVSVSWLPPYHDMGLIGSTLTPLAVGFPAVFMPPAAFLRRPLTWLQAITRFRGTIGGAPNFAYALCVAKLTPERAAQLDLSSWRVAFTGAEPVRVTTLDDFTQAFAPYGFRRRQFHPCYGLAESTLMVSGLPTGDVPVVVALDAAEFAAGRAVRATHAARVVVGSGKPPSAVRVVIVQPETHVRLADGEIGEIWVASPSNAAGYWRRSGDETFGATLADGDGPFLRTGDTGFLLDGGLFVTGRCKEVIIVNGRNLYPRDIEEVACDGYPALDPDCSVAFSTVVHDREAVVFTAELRSNDPQVRRDAAAAVRAALMRELDVAVFDVHFVGPGAIPRTSSGKLRRLAMRDEYRAATLEPR